MVPEGDPFIFLVTPILTMSAGISNANLKFLLFVSLQICDSIGLAKQIAYHSEMVKMVTFPFAAACCCDAYIETYNLQICIQTSLNLFKMIYSLWKRKLATYSLCKFMNEALWIPEVLFWPTP